MSEHTAKVDAAARVIAADAYEALAWDALDGKPHVRDSEVKAAIRERHRDLARRVLAAARVIPPAVEGDGWMHDR